MKFKEDYLSVTRTHTGFQAPASLPNVEYLLRTFGHLIERNETVRLDIFAERIERHYSHARCVIEAGEIRRWFDLMNTGNSHEGSGQKHLQK